MSSPPNQTARLARRAAGRIRLARTLRLAGRGLVVGAAAALLTAAAGKALPLDQTVTITIAAVSAGVALLASAAIGLTRRVTDTEGAGRLDESLRLHDRFTTAVELSEAPHRSVFGELALADAEKRAGGVSPARLIPLRPDRRVWGAGVIGLVLAASVVLFVPVRQVEPAPAFASSTARQRQAAGERIAEVAESLAPEPITDTDPAQGDPVTARADNLASELDEIQKRLERGELDAEDALATAAERLEAAAEESEARAAESAQTERSLAEAAAAAAAAAQSGDETAELAESLASGDLSRASEAARRLSEQSRGMPPEARERIARDLDTLAESLERAGAEEPPPGPGEQSEGLDESLREQLRERVGDLTDEDAVAEALQQEGLDAEAASDLADRLARDERDRQRTERTREDLRRLRDAVERTAEDVRKPAPDQSDPTQNEPAGTDPAETDPADQGPEPQDPAGSDPTESPPADSEQGEPGQGEEPAENPSPPGASDPTDQSPASEQGQDPGQEPAEGTDPKPASDPGGQQEGEAGEPKEPGEGDQPSDQPGEQPGEQPTDQPGTQPGQQPGESPTEGEGTPPGEQSEQQPGEQPGESQTGEPASENQPSGEQGQGQQQGQEPGQGEGQGQPNPDASEQGASEQQGRGQDGEQGGEPSPDAGESGSGESDSGEPGSGEPGSGQSGSGDPGSEPPRSLSEELDRLADRQRQRRADEQRAAELRRKAQELLDDATPEERERLEEMAERLAQQNRLPQQGPTEPWDAAERTVDARDPNATPGDGDNEQVLAEWYNPEGDPADGVERGEASAQRLREAAESAERAVEQQRVPPRYRRLVRDMYKRLQDRAAEREGAAPLAEQVEKKSDAPKKDDGSGGDGDD